MVPVNWLAVIVAAIANMAIGFAWYSDGLFGKHWRKLSGVSEGKPTQDWMIKMMVLGMAGALLTAYVLSHDTAFAQSYLGTTGVALGAMTGFWNWLGFMFPISLSGYLYEKKPIELVCINTGFWLVSTVVMGIIIAVWQ